MEVAGIGRWLVEGVVAQGVLIGAQMLRQM
jgi:hypothetical protein